MANGLEPTGILKSRYCGVKHRQERTSIFLGALQMTDPLVSVKMITYNHASYIAQAIEGVLQQKTTFPFELVIGEDCSTDGTRDIVTNYQKKYPHIIHLVISDKNVGMIINGERTRRACRGKFIAYCEGDDFWHRSDKLQLQVEYLNRHENCGLVCSDFDVLYQANGKVVKNWNQRNRLNPSKIRNIKYVLRGTPSSGIQTCTVMARNELVSQVIEDNEEIFRGTPQPCGDTPFFTAMFSLSGIGYIDESLAVYRRTALSATHNPSKAVILRTSIAMKEQMLWLIEKYELPNDEKELHLEDLWKRKLKLAFYEQNAKLAFEAANQLNHLSFIERLQFIGATNANLNRLFKPVLNTVCRDLIPTVKKD
jgi:glycosyltransferase involved in cell wall biosynthesis